MRRWDRIVLLVALVALAPVLAACADFDPDKLDVFNLNDKKKLPGERKPLFPEGVPGVTQGIPPEYLKGNQPPPETAQAAPVEPVQASGPLEASGPDNKSAGTTPPSRTAAASPVQIAPQVEPEPKSKAKPKPKHKAKAKAKAKPKPKPRTVAAPSQPAAQQQPQAPWPEPQQQQAQPAWPSAAPTNAQSPWPSAPSSGTISR
jgi:hypothetical protein